MTNKNCLILGASSDIGRELVNVLAKDNHKIFAHYNSKADFPSEVTALQADLAGEGVADLIDNLQKQCEVPDSIILLPAPKAQNIRFKDTTWDDFQINLDIQFKATVVLLQKFLPLMAARKSGRVIFMLSSYTMGNPPKNLAHYTSVKYALLGLMRSLAVEYAEKGITINSISPSMVDTAFLSELPEKIKELAAEKHPMKRNATPSDIAPIIQFLMSSHADYINGSNIPITGGSTL